MNRICKIPKSGKGLLYDVLGSFFMRRRSGMGRKRLRRIVCLTLEQVRCVLVMAAQGAEHVLVQLVRPVGQMGDGVENLAWAGETASIGNDIFVKPIEKGKRFPARIPAYFA